MTSPSGYIGCTISGLTLGVAVQAPTEKRRELKTIFEGGPGDAQEQLAWRAEGYPVRTFKRSWLFPIQHIRAYYDQIEAILAGPGPFDFCFWKPTHHQFLSNGSRTEFFLPHAGGVATDTLTPPDGASITPFLPVVQLGVGSEGDVPPLTYSKVSSGTYATGPSTGNVYFLESSNRFKIASADVPATGDPIVARYVPLYQVIEGTSLDKRYPDNAREPRSLELMEI